MRRGAPGKNKKCVDIVNETCYIQPIGEIGNTFSGRNLSKISKKEEESCLQEMQFREKSCV